MKKFLIALVALSFIACSGNQEAENEEPDMYDASEMSLLMREMVDFSKVAKKKFEDGEGIDYVPKHFFLMPQLHATRNEQEDPEFQAMAAIYLNHLRDMVRSDSQAYYYQQSIEACKSCHSTYCGGPLVVIEQLNLNQD